MTDLFEVLGEVFIVPSQFFDKFGFKCDCCAMSMTKPEASNSKTEFFAVQVANRVFFVTNDVAIFVIDSVMHICIIDSQVHFYQTL